MIHPKDHWTLKTGNFEDLIPAIQVQTLPLEGPRSLGQIQILGVLSFFCSIFAGKARTLTKSCCFFFGVAIQKKQWNPPCTTARKKGSLLLVDLVAGFKFPFEQTHASKQKGSSYLPQDSAKPKKNNTTQFYDIIYNKYQVYEFKIHRKSPSIWPTWIFCIHLPRERTTKNLVHLKQMNLGISQNPPVLGFNPLGGALSHTPLAPHQ